MIIRKLIATASVLGVAGLGAIAGTAPAGALGAQCKGADVKPRIHNEAVRRENTLDNLTVKLQPQPDSFGMNSTQLSNLASAKSGISALDAQIASTCYPTLAALHADATKIFVDYRVYWLRVPQTHVIGASDRLARASSKLSTAASKLAPLVGSNAQAQADLATMNQAITAANAKLGVPPTPGPSIAAIRDLVPGADMTAADAALRTAHEDLVAIRQQLNAARIAGQKVVADLRG